MPRIIKKQFSKMPIDPNKLPPQNIEAEQSVLGSLLIDKDAIIKIADIISAEDFYRRAHEEIFQAVVDLYQKREPIDLLSLSSRLKEKRILRDLIGASHEISQLAWEDKDIDELLDEAEKKIFSISQTSLIHEFQHIKPYLHEAFERIDRLHKGDGAWRGIPTGFADLDNILAGLQQADLVILAAR